MATTELFNRRAKITITSATTPLYDTSYSTTQEGDFGVVIENLRIEFEIEHNSSKHPNQCLIKVTNLSKDTRSALKKSPLKLVLEAGYVNDTAVIFQGDITYANTTQEGTNWITEIQCADGGRTLRHARVNKNYAPGTPKLSVLKDMMAQTQKELPDYIKDIPGLQGVIDSGLSVLDTHQNAVTELVKPAGLTYSIQDEKPVFLGPDDTHGEPYELGETHAMIGSPEFGKPDKKGRPPDVTVRSLLYPQIRPGHPVKVTSRELNGVFKVSKVKHSGDTHGENWLTEVEIKTPGTVGTSAAGGRSGSSGFGGGQTNGGGAGQSF